MDNKNEIYVKTEFTSQYKLHLLFVFYTYKIHKHATHMYHV